MRFVGIDVHKVNCQICAFDDVTGEILEKRIPTTAPSLQEFFKGWEPCRILIEAATESEWVARVLERLGHEVIVADPNFAPMYATRDKKVKTDKRDARALMEATKLGAYRKSHRVSDVQRTVRRRLAVRDALIGSRSKMINTARAVTRQDGYRVPSGEAETFHLRVRAMEIGQEVKDVLAPLLGAMEELTEQIALCDEEVVAIGQSKETQLLQTIPNIGPITSVAFVATLDNCERFPGARNASSYLGLVPSEFSSGEKRHRGAITKRGNARMRWLLVQAAHGIMRKETVANKPLHNWARAVEMRGGKNVAVVGLARRLGRVLFAVWSTGLPYDERRVQPRKVVLEPAM